MIYSNHLNEEIIAKLCFWTVWKSWRNVIRQRVSSEDEIMFINNNQSIYSYYWPTLVPTSQVPGWEAHQLICVGTEKNIRKVSFHPVWTSLLGLEYEVSLCSLFLARFISPLTSWSAADAYEYVQIERADRTADGVKGWAVMRLKEGWESLWAEQWSLGKPRKPPAGFVGRAYRQLATAHCVSRWESRSLLSPTCCMCATLGNTHIHSYVWNIFPFESRHFLLDTVSLKCGPRSNLLIQKIIKQFFSDKYFHLKNWKLYYYKYIF